MKRTLSFIVAFLMVVTVFALSAPAARVAAAGSDYQEWVLPTDWSSGKVEQYKGWDIPVQGPWKLQGFSDLDTATPYLNDDANIVEYDALTSYNHNSDKDKTTFPYMGTDHNESKTQNKVVSGYYHATYWYVNYGARWGGMIFESKQDSTGLVYVGDAGQHAAIVFTAPADGVYNYDALISGLLFETALSKEPLSFTATVRKNGEILQSFTPTPEMDSEIFQGEVELKAGDLLMFAFQQNTDIILGPENAGLSDPDCMTISNLVIWTGTPTAEGGGDAGEGEGEGSGNENQGTPDAGNTDNKKDTEEKADPTKTIIIVAAIVVVVATVAVCTIVIVKRRKA